MKVYNGWVLRIAGAEWTVLGSMKMRGVQSYVIGNASGKRSISRDELLAALIS